MKKLKYVLIALLAIVLCVGGYILYELKFKTYDVADAEVDKLLEELFEVELPDGRIVQIDKDGKIIEQGSASTGNNTETVANGTSDANTSTNPVDGENNPGTNEATADGHDTTTNSKDGTVGASTGAGSGTSTSTTTAPATTPEKLTVADIKGQYASTFKMLENQSRTRLNGLIGQAKNEYSTKKSNGESIKYGYFYNKYMGAATGIEASTDAAVNGVINLVEQDLMANGYDKSYAQSFKEEYTTTKEALRGEMLDKALDF